MAKQLPIETPAYVARRMWNYLVAHKGRALYTFVIYMVSTLMGAVVPLQIGATVDDVVAGKFSSYPWQPILIILAAFIVQAVTLMVSSYSAARLGALVTRDTNQDTLDGTLDLDARTVEEAGSGDLLTRVTDDLSSAASSVSTDLLGAIYVVLYFVISTISLAFVSPAMGLIMLPMIAGLALIMSKMLPLMAARNQTAQECVSDLNSVLTENIRGTSTIRELGVHAAREEVFSAENKERLFGAQLGMVRIRQLYFTVDAINSWMPTILCMLWGTACVALGWASWGAVATASVMVFSLRVLTDMLNHHVSNLRIMLVNMGRVFGVVSLAKKQREARAKHRAEAFAAVSDAAVKNPEYAIDCSQVSYGYSPDALVLEDITLKIRRGEALALVGRSGSGKTTLARLIGGSLTALDGTISVMGRPVGHGDFPTDAAADGRPRLLVCTQEAHVFFGTLADNFTVVVPDATVEQMGEALDAVGARWWRDLPQGMETVVSGADSPLTRDQIQQLALARIVLADPHAVILDESTTQLELADATESLRAVLANRAVLIISHDARIASLADRAVLLHEGRIIAEGSPAEIFALT
ncbi:ABC transporter ATP-binding protein [uncultured Rothia sp.]|uniref:ABC transporter ATP-binding protein n=1 Tax=uncultured Rothia sp. TaxID=316088 RepID=UPI002889A5A3|nr:ABC transporter ATP-binding protein [uncultured Rothia sp.]